MKYITSPVSCIG